MRGLNINHLRIAGLFILPRQYCTISTITTCNLMKTSGSFPITKGITQFSTGNVVGAFDTTTAEKKDGLLKKVLKKVGFSQNTRLKLKSCMLYENASNKINYRAFFDYFNLPNTFNSWFLVTELHVWMLLLRAMAEGSEKGEDGRFIRNTIVEALWSDVNIRAKKLGTQNPSATKKQIQILSEQFQAALIAYDEGIMSDDMILATALWRRMFESNCKDYQRLEQLVNYVRLHVNMLDSLNREKFLLRQNIKWIELTDVIKSK